MNIEWNLSCSKNDALDKLNDAFDKKSLIRWYKIQGKIKGNSFKIWTETPGMRGIRIALGKGQIIDNGNDVSSLKTSISILWPFSYFRFSSVTLALIIFVAVVSWVLSLLGGIFQKYEMLSSIFFPIGSASILLLFLSFIRYLGESEKNDLHKFLKGIFLKYIK